MELRRGGLNGEFSPIGVKDLGESWQLRPCSRKRRAVDGASLQEEHPHEQQQQQQGPQSSESSPVNVLALFLQGLDEIQKDVLSKCEVPVMIQASGKLIKGNVPEVNHGQKKRSKATNAKGCIPAF